MVEFIKFSDSSIHIPVIKVMGLGGGGCNAINRMIELGITGVDFIGANTDYQALQTCLAPEKLLLGPQMTRGLGAGGKPEIGRAAAEESEDEIASVLHGADMVFLTAGMGGGTGTGSIPIAARVARSIGAVTIAIVTTPFAFEMGHRQKNATQGLFELTKYTDTLIAIPNDRLLQVAPRNLPLDLAFRLADDVLRQAVQGITELITEPGLINVDFAHIRQMMKLGGGALMAMGQGKGSQKAAMALHQALHHPLLEEISIDQAAGIIANFTGGQDLTLFEVSEVLTTLHEQTGPDTEIIFGLTNDDRLQGRAQVILVVTGLGAPAVDAASLQISPWKGKTSERQVNEQDLSTITPLLPQEPVEVFPTVPNPSLTDDLDVPAFLRRRMLQNP